MSLAKTNKKIDEVTRQDIIGKKIAEILKLRPSKKHPTRFQTAWGDKTAIGIYNTIQRLSEDSKKNDFLDFI